MNKLDLKVTSFNWFRETNIHISPISFYFGYFNNITNIKINNNVSITAVRKWNISRKTKHNSGLSFLLNLTDGLLVESLRIQIIATLNTDIQNIDKSLLGKGKLTSIYEFKKLTIEKINAHLQKNDKEIQVLQELTLAVILI